MGYVPRKNVFRKMEEIWDIIIVIYWVLMGGSLLMIIVKLIIPHYLFSIDDVTKNKAEVFQSVLNVIEGDLGIQVNGLSIKYDYTKNDELKGFYDPSNHSITLFMDNLESVHSFILTITEEIHHSVFVSSKSGMKLYQSYQKKVGYNNNPLEYAAKVYAKDKFKLIHRNLKKRGLISYKV